jgi:hypothetical protein
MDARPNRVVAAFAEAAKGSLALMIAAAVVTGIKSP